MAELIQMTALSPTMEKGQIMSWLKKEGDSVESGDVLCEVETDKAVMEYEAVAEGILLKILVPANKMVEVGVPIAVVGQEGEDYSSLLKEDSGSDADVSGSDDRGAAEQSSGPAREPSSEEKAPPAAADKGRAGSERVPSSPLARRMARQKGLDITALTGSGPGGRVVKKDVEKALANGPAGAARTAAAVPGPESAAEDVVVPHSAMRRTIAERLSGSFYSAPHYYLTVSADVGVLLESRKRLAEKSGDSLSVNAILVKMAAQALKNHPRVNAAWEADGVRQFARQDIGLAVALKDGLITPVVKQAGLKGLKQIDAELSDLVDKARNGGLSPEEYSGATFTISNLGSFGIEEFTAIINPPGSAILAVGAAVPRVVPTDGGGFETRTLMKMTLSCDHRVIDGAVGAAFLAELKQMIEEPLRALL